jgi:hypothetical protein
MRKQQILEHWKGLRPNQPIKPRVVPYKHEGSTFDQDGIRITGTPEFIDSVLSRLQDLLKLENTQTRLQVSYQQANDKKTGLPLGTYTAYIQVHQRGREAAAVNEFASGLAGREVILSRGY